jgi:Uma2 family endonuclease
MAAASTTPLPGLLSIEQYFNTSYRPDVDYVDGILEERNVGDTGHAKVQTRLAVLLSLMDEEWRTETMTEVRVQVSPTRFRIPDVCVVRQGDADERTVTAAPLLCLEVLSPDDALTDTRRRAQDYFTMGVPEVWIFNPITDKAYVCTTDSMIEHTEGTLRLAGTAIELSIEEAFKPLKKRS